MKEDFTKKILNKIKKNKIKPKARWEFLLKNYSFWFSGLLSLFIGALAFSVIIFIIRNNDWDLFQYAGKSLGVFVLATLPYFWLLSLILFLAVAYYYYKHTKKGYHYKMSLIVTLVLILSVCLGTLFYSVGFGQALEQTFSKRMPFYKHMMGTSRNFWLKAEEGRLAGMVTEIKTSDFFVLKDLNDKYWDVDARAAMQKGMIEIRSGNQIKILGKQVENNKFEAELIVPFLRHTKPLWHPWKCMGRAKFKGRQLLNN